MFGRRKCDPVRDLFWNYAANRLTEADRERVENHLPGCTACTVEMEETRKTVRLVSAYRQEAVPETETNWQALRSRLETLESRPVYAPRPSERRLSPFRGAVSVASLTVAVLLVSLMVRTLQQPPRSNNTIKIAGVSPLPSGLSTDVSAARSKNSAPSAAKKGSKAPVRRERKVEPGQDGIRDVETFRAALRRRRNGLPLRPPKYMVQHPDAKKSAAPAAARSEVYSVDGDNPVTVEPPREYVIGAMAIQAEQQVPTHYVIGGVPSPQPVSNVPLSPDEVD